MLTKGAPLYLIQENNTNPIALSNLKDPPHNNKSKYQSFERLNPHSVLFNLNLLIYVILTKD